MSIGAILIGIALLIITVPVVAGPVVTSTVGNKRRERFPLVDKPEEPAAHEQYHQALLALRELDFDHQLEVLGDEDYAAQRMVLMAQAAQAKERIIHTDNDDLEARIETAIRAHRDQPRNEKETVRSCYHCGVEMDPTDKFCSECGTPAASNCPRCGEPFHPHDKFCASCGQALVVGVMG